MSSSKTADEKELLEDVENIFNQFLMLAFGMYDKDKNGLISPEELQKGLGYSVDDYCSRIISALDTDGDGNINFEEFKMMMQKDIE
ncbi:hypothetical protein MKX01_008860 [Papaver californicum]|nr:hypothetical protein MKX01_008860 [Papaver californicum]